MLIIKDLNKEKKNLEKIKKILLFFLKKGIYKISNKKIPFLILIPTLTIVLYEKRPDELLSKISRLNQMSWYKAPYRYIASYGTQIKKLKIDIPQKEIMQISQDRENAIKSGFILPSMKNFRNIKITFQDKTLKAKIRLKGDMLDHVKTNKWSYRVELKNNKTLFGLKKFSLQSPRRRAFLNEWLFHELLKYEGLPFLRYKLVELYINGKYKGIYSLEEHFDKLTIENSKYREGPIIGLEESNWWKNQIKGLTNTEEINNFENDIQKRRIKLFDRKNILKNNNQKFLYLNAENKLRRFIKNNHEFSDTFEAEKFGKYLAIIDLLGAGHNLHWNQLRLYYNPITGKFIPIGFDSNPGISIKRMSYDTSIFGRSLLEEKQVINNYNKNLEKIISNEYWEEFIKKSRNKKINLLKKMHRSYPWYDLKDYPSFIKENKNVIKNYLYPTEHLITRLIFKNNSSVNLEIKNNADSPIEINKILIDNKFLNTNVFKLDGRLSEKKVINIADKELINLIINNARESTIDISVFNKSIGTNDYKRDISKAFLINEYEKNDLNNQSSFNKKLLNIKNFTFLKIDNKSKQIFIPNGVYYIEKTLFIPKEYDLIVEKGTEINFLENGAIYSEGEIYLNGTKGSTIKINGKSNNNYIALFNTQNTSMFSYVEFDGLSINNLKNISGSISTYESDIKIYNCKFKNIKSEDAINVFRSKFDIKSTSFFNIKSDAIDIDFGEGTLKNLDFSNIGNDGIDISGTNLYLKNIKMKNISDKGLSAGEKSKLFFDNLELSNSSIGITSKDSSEIIGNNLKLNSLEVGFAAYTKKPEYDGGSIIISNYEYFRKDKYSNTTKLYLLEDGSSININQIQLEKNSENVKDLFYGKLYGKKTVR
tara:strand:- start:1056 stop:3692 length:2637 start_codon:yes stop_codon:yes gene_type:complete